MGRLTKDQAVALARAGSMLAYITDRNGRVFAGREGHHGLLVQAGEAAERRHVDGGMLAGGENKIRIGGASVLGNPLGGRQVDVTARDIQELVVGEEPPIQVEIATNILGRRR